MPFDLGQFESRKLADEGVEFQIFHPRIGPCFDENGKKVWIKLGHLDGPRMRQIMRDGRKARDKRVEEQTKLDDKYELNQEDAGREDLALLTLGWSENWMLDGKPLEFSFENALAIYKRFPEVADQMTRHATTRANFMPAASSDS